MGRYKLFDSINEAADKIPLNKAVKVKAGNKELCVARTQKGIFAVDNECPHLGESLSKGQCNPFNEIVCPWHNFRFNLETGDETSGKDLEVNIYKVDVIKEGVYIEV